MTLVWKESLQRTPGGCRKFIQVAGLGLCPSGREDAMGRLNCAIHPVGARNSNGRPGVIPGLSPSELRQRAPGLPITLVENAEGRRDSVKLRPTKDLWHAHVVLVRAHRGHTGNQQDIRNHLRGRETARDLRFLRWAMRVSNPRPLPCEGSALPLS